MEVKSSVRFPVYNYNSDDTTSSLADWKYVCRQSLEREAWESDSDDEEWLDVSASQENVDSSESQQQGKSLIWKSKLELNTEVVERLRKPAEMAEFCSAIQRSMHEARGSGDNKTVPVSPPKLVQGGINPAGAALVQQQKASTNNRMPGNIVCGICGAVRYYAFILQAKKFGTFR